MSDSWITLVPEDPHFVPTSERQEMARRRLVEIAPDSQEVRAIATESVEFFDCGENFMKIICPSCSQEISIDWWQESMNDDYEGGFKLDNYSTPCCDASTTLRELIYDWPQAFGCFALDAMNPMIGELDEIHHRELEEIHGTKLIVIYQHI